MNKELKEVRDWVMWILEEETFRQRKESAARPRHGSLPDWSGTARRWKRVAGIKVREVWNP